MIILLKFNGRTVPSVNDIYVRHKYKKSIVVMTKEAREFKNIAKNQLKEALTDEAIMKLKSIDQYELKLEFVLKQGVMRRDTDNMVKLIQDSIFETIGVNDAKVVKGTQEKYNRTGGNYEFIVIEIKRAEIDINKYIK